jgi:hypothetical protein
LDTPLRRLSGTRISLVPPSEIGQTHKFGTRYLANYANEAAYREDTRRLSNGEIFRDIPGKCAHTHTHRDWCGYWQGNKRLQERLAA